MIVSSGPQAFFSMTIEQRFVRRCQLRTRCQEAVFPVRQRKDLPVVNFALRSLNFFVLLLFATVCMTSSQVYRIAYDFTDTPQPLVQIFFCSSKLHRKSLVAFPTIVALVRFPRIAGPPWRSTRPPASLESLCRTTPSSPFKSLPAISKRGLEECQGFQGLHRPLVQVVFFGVGLRVFLVGLAHATLFYCAGSSADARDPPM